MEMMDSAIRLHKDVQKRLVEGLVVGAVEKSMAKIMNINQKY